MYNIWHSIGKDRITPERFDAVIEISKGGKNKYELDKEVGILRLDRVLYTSTHYPANYGFIPRTLSEDGDPLDVLVMCQEAIVPMTLVRCIPIGVIRMVDNEETDEKIIAVPERDPSLSWCADISGLPTHHLEEMSHFFTVYKALEGKSTYIKETLGHEAAMRVIRENIAAYEREFGTGTDDPDLIE